MPLSTMCKQYFDQDFPLFHQNFTDIDMSPIYHLNLHHLSVIFIWKNLKYKTLPLLKSLYFECRQICSDFLHNSEGFWVVVCVEVEQYSYQTQPHLSCGENFGGVVTMKQEINPNTDS